jgi:hypothetical protein
MRKTLLAATAVAVVGLIGAPPAQAQDYPPARFDIGVFGGGSWYSTMLGEEHVGTDTEDVRYEAGWVTGLQATWWLSPRFGLRANGAYSERPIVGGEESQQNADGDLATDINLWSLSGDLMVRLGDPGGRFVPFLALGVGAKNTNPARDNPIPGTDGETGLSFQAEPGGAVFYQVEEWTPMGLVGLGGDFRMADNFALRLEVGDRIWDATLRSDFTLASDPEEDVGNVINEIYGQLGLHLLFGLEEPEVIAVAPTPPPPAPEPEPEPEPIEEDIVVCVIDPSADGGIRNVNAIYLPETGDTMVVVNGARQPISGTLPTVMLANDADWFVRGEPLTINMGGGVTMEYTTWQSARMIDSDDLVFLGTSRGLPVYAAADDVADVREQLREARAAAATGDLDDIVEQNRELRQQMNDIEFLYVPLQPTGCVFQTVQVVEQVRKKDDN